jgi:ketosteroid isomerase-like protein
MTRPAALASALLVGAASLLGCGGASNSTDWPKVDRTALEADLRRTDVEFAEATEKRGAEGWVSYFADDGAQLSARAEIVRGPDAVREQMSTFFAKGDRRLTWRPLIVQVSPAGDMGFTYGPYQVLSVGRDGATELIRKGTYMTVWRREKDGRWKVVADLGSQEPSR